MSAFQSPLDVIDVAAYGARGDATLGFASLGTNSGDGIYNAIVAAKDAQVSYVWLGPGIFKMRDAGGSPKTLDSTLLDFSSMPGRDLVIMGAGRGRTVLWWPDDLGVDAHGGNPNIAINPINAQPANSLQLWNLSLQGSSTGRVDPNDTVIPLSTGSGVRVANRSYMKNIGIDGFRNGLLHWGVQYAGSGVPQFTDHFTIEDVLIQTCHYGVYVQTNTPVGTSGGTRDFTYRRLVIASCQMAGFAAADDGLYGDVTFDTCHTANVPYAFYKEFTPAGGHYIPEARLFDGVHFIRTKSENAGNAVIGDQSKLGESTNVHGLLEMHGVSVNSGVKQTAIIGVNHTFKPFAGSASRASDITTVTGLPTTSITGNTYGPGGAMPKTIDGFSAPLDQTYVGAAITGTDVNSGTTLASVALDGMSATLSQNASGSHTGSSASFVIAHTGLRVGALIAMSSSDVTFIDCAAVTAVGPSNAGTIVCRLGTGSLSNASASVLIGEIAGIQTGSITESELTVEAQNDPTSANIDAINYWDLDGVADNSLYFEGAIFPSVDIRGAGTGAGSGALIERSMNTIGWAGRRKAVLAQAGGTFAVGDVLDRGTNGLRLQTAGSAAGGFLYGGIARTPGALAASVAPRGTSNQISVVSRPYAWAQLEGSFYSADSSSGITVNNGVPAGNADAHSLLVVDGPTITSLLGTFQSAATTVTVNAPLDQAYTGSAITSADGHIAAPTFITRISNDGLTLTLSTSTSGLSTSIGLTIGATNTLRQWKGVGAGLVAVGESYAAASGGFVSVDLFPAFMPGASDPHVSLSDVVATPAAAIAATYNRDLNNSDQAILTSGTLYLAAIALHRGAVCGSITWYSKTTAAAGCSHCWFVLCDNTGAKLVATTDDTSLTPWTATTAKTLTCTPFTTLYDGLYYLGVCVVGTTVPTLQGFTSNSNTLFNLPPIRSATGPTGLTTPASFTGTPTLTAIAKVGYGWVSQS